MLPYLRPWKASVGMEFRDRVHGFLSLEGPQITRAPEITWEIMGIRAYLEKERDSGGGHTKISANSEAIQ